MRADSVLRELSVPCLRRTTGDSEIDIERPGGNLRTSSGICFFGGFLSIYHAWVSQHLSLLCTGNTLAGFHSR